MPVQYALSGGLAFAGEVCPEDIDLVLDDGLAYYHSEAQRIGEADCLEVLLRRLSFAVLSVHTNFFATCRAYEKLREVDPGDWSAIYRTLQSEPLVQYPWQKTKALARLYVQVYDDAECLFPNGDDLEYRSYIQGHVWGLAWAKSSFGVMLVKGSADVACIDTHMYRLFTGKAAKGQIGKRLYLELESRVRDLAGRHGAMTSEVQHCLWDAIRGGGRSVLLPKEGE